MASATKATIDPREAEHFGKLAADWWNPRGSSAMLHRLNPARLGYVRAAIDAHWGGDSSSFAPLAGKTAIDVGCGAGLLAEPLARLGARVTGIDAAPENVGAARAHAAATGLAVEYVAGGIEDLPGRAFDLVTSMEVIEHVTDPAAFVAALAGALAEGGLMVLSTPNRTLASHLAMITLAEGTGAIPPGTHDWRKFLRPEELEDLLHAAGLKVIDRTGLGFSPARGFVTGTGEALNYLVTVVRA
ncbi:MULTISPECIES: bifunctional 2-polyprenyl-6-hydroxyphenol methylase/3-demethylubiquinol 3-O-methyltransferase UbiG [unclassified Sphingomonas]|jgi:2-polyprenyl-6-hydroxyphenyl methylase / 3-demethylubiquinone-9 3-methyltransferase|uniref:bifunctional 2-polyprenyl-6-hydroxyphenol methylase/3-demethylubiquinol 3-O-methyltransferase UbiG n=1 Tax=unclassified Sphingomonas TaxID=196159 RepID=UPI000B2CE274|nr:MULTISPECIES: bifunctional 2-polyprenyl-6-hydroxyphenol methylase/3-demethylubiquinol 3-O-methyltransferase UbiG [unclassified Sphingomonas]